MADQPDRAFHLLPQKYLQTSWGRHAASVMSAALDAVEPGAAVGRFLRISRSVISIAGQEYDLKDINRIFMIGAGKAAVPMGLKTADILGKYLDRGLLITKHGYLKNMGLGDHAAYAAGKLQFVEGGHPVPDRDGQIGAEQIADLAAQAGQDDLIICLMSGGGSALLASPAPGITLDDLKSLTGLLLACGANINEINTLRKHLEILKGGGLTRLAAPARLAALILSDVVGDPLDVIASGPTVPDNSSFEDGLRIVERYHIQDQVPEAILNRLADGQRRELPETPKPGDPIFERVQNVVIGSNRLAALAGVGQARSLGYNALLLTTGLQGEARAAGQYLAALAQEIHASGNPIPRPACLIIGGETTVTLLNNTLDGTNSGLGGRNQELALGAVHALSGLENTALITLASDGGDGPTDAAGAVVTGETLDLANREGLDPIDFLARNDSYHFFERLGSLIKTGPTHTNVNDLNFIFVY